MSKFELLCSCGDAIECSNECECGEDYCTGESPFGQAVHPTFGDNVGLSVTIAYVASVADDKDYLRQQLSMALHG